MTNVKIDATARAPMRPSWQGWMYALAATFCFSMAPAIARGALVTGTDPTELLMARTLLATLLFALLIGAAAPRHLALPRKYLLPMFVSGTANGVAMLFFFQGLVRIDASIASMMLALLPLLVLLMLMLRGEKLEWRHAVRLSLALSGVYLLIGPGGAVDTVGILVLVVAMLLFASQLVIVQWYLQGLNPRTIGLYMSIFMLAATGVWWLWQGPSWHVPGPDEWVAILVLGAVSTFLARIFFYEGIQRIGGAQVVLLIPLELLLNLFWAALFLSERLTPLQWGGALLIMTSTFLAVKRLPITRLTLLAGHRRIGRRSPVDGR